MHLKDMTGAQYKSLIEVSKRVPYGREHYVSIDDLVESASFATADDCIMVPWCNMSLGIEADGYTHT